MIQAAALDLDGTIIGPDEKISPAVHEAITRLARVLQPLDLARMVGHRDLKMLLTYYDESAEDIAKRLD